MHRLKFFGRNYDEFYHKRREAVAHLLEQKQGQVVGAYHRKDLGDLDLPFGEYDKEADKGIGLIKIIEKHAKRGDFKDFGGANEIEQAQNALDEIIDNGKLLTQNGVHTIFYQKDGKEYKIGISKGWDKKGENNWIITGYKFEKGDSGKTSDDAAFRAGRPPANAKKDSSALLPMERERCDFGAELVQRF